MFVYFNSQHNASRQMPLLTFLWILSWYVYLVDRWHMWTNIHNVTNPCTIRLKYYRLVDLSILWSMILITSIIMAINCLYPSWIHENIQYNPCTSISFIYIACWTSIHRCLISIMNLLGKERFIRYSNQIKSYDALFFCIYSVINANRITIVF